MYRVYEKYCNTSIVARNLWHEYFMYYHQTNCYICLFSYFGQQYVSSFWKRGKGEKLTTLSNWAFKKVSITSLKWWPINAEYLFNFDRLPLRIRLTDRPVKILQQRSSSTVLQPCTKWRPVQVRQLVNFDKKKFFFQWCHGKLLNQHLIHTFKNEGKHFYPPVKTIKSRFDGTFILIRESNQNKY